MTKYTRIVVFETKSGDRYVTSPLYLPIGPGKVDTDVCDVSWEHPSHNLRRGKNVPRLRESKC